MMEIIGKRIRKLRLEHNLGQKDLAIKLNLSKSTISHYERGDRTIPLETIVRIANLFEVDINFILGTSSKVKSKKRVLLVSDDEIEFLLELRKISGYKYMISNPRNYAKLIEMKTSDYVVKM